MRSNQRGIKTHEKASGRLKGQRSVREKGYTTRKSAASSRGRERSKPKRKSIRTPRPGAKARLIQCPAFGRREGSGFLVTPDIQVLDKNVFDPFRDERTEEEE